MTTSHDRGTAAGVEAGVACVVCRAPAAVRGFFCKSCQRSYDVARAKDATAAALIEWTAKRAYTAGRNRERARIGALLRGEHACTFGMHIAVEIDTKDRKP